MHWRSVVKTKGDRGKNRIYHGLLHKGDKFKDREQIVYTSETLKMEEASYTETPVHISRQGVIYQDTCFTSKL